jgi:hypothetical protein
MKFGSRAWSIFLIHPFGLDKISYHFVSYMNKISCSAWVSQLPKVGLSHFCLVFWLHFVQHIDIIIISDIILTDWYNDDWIKVGKKTTLPITTCDWIST